MSFLNSPPYQSHVTDYEYDEVDDFYDENHLNNDNHGYDGVDDSEGNNSGKYQTPISKRIITQKTNQKVGIVLFSDTEEASESEYGRSGRPHDEPLEIKEQ